MVPVALRTLASICARWLMRGRRGLESPHSPRSVRLFAPRASARRGRSSTCRRYCRSCSLRDGQSLGAKRRLSFSRRFAADTPVSRPHPHCGQGESLTLRSFFFSPPNSQCSSAQVSMDSSIQAKPLRRAFDACPRRCARAPCSQSPRLTACGHRRDFFALGLFWPAVPAPFPGRSAPIIGDKRGAGASPPAPHPLVSPVYFSGSDTSFAKSEFGKIRSPILKGVLSAVSMMSDVRFAGCTPMSARSVRTALMRSITFSKPPLLLPHSSSAVHTRAIFPASRSGRAGSAV